MNIENEGNASCNCSAQGRPDIMLGRKLVDWSRPIETEDGREAKLLDKDFHDDSDYTVVAKVTERDGVTQTIHYFTDDGFFYASKSPNGCNLRNKPTIVEDFVYINVYPKHQSTGYEYVPHDTQEAADSHRSAGRITVVKVPISFQLPPCS
jgi:hypothetical protein